MPAAAWRAPHCCSGTRGHVPPSDRRCGCATPTGVLGRPRDRWAAATCASRAKVWPRPSARSLEHDLAARARRQRDDAPRERRADRVGQPRHARAEVEPVGAGTCRDRAGPRVWLPFDAAARAAGRRAWRAWKTSRRTRQGRCGRVQPQAVERLVVRRGRPTTTNGRRKRARAGERARARVPCASPVAARQLPKRQRPKRTVGLQPHAGAVCPECSGCRCSGCRRHTGARVARGGERTSRRIALATRRGGPS